MESYVIFTESTGDLTPAPDRTGTAAGAAHELQPGWAGIPQLADGREISSHDYYDKLRAGSACVPPAW